MLFVDLPHQSGHQGLGYFLPLLQVVSLYSKGRTGRSQGSQLPVCTVGRASNCLLDDLTNRCLRSVPGYTGCRGQSQNLQGRGGIASTSCSESQRPAACPYGGNQSTGQNRRWQDLPDRPGTA
eukprot:TRINITY_DN25712_c0_g1_i1.p3 TRINITY_DN25712_c0_g1~~TRINITY_DN25712_c0_g1_i1.p3  ORF type:complete len:123 (-),score=2.52 TRINITY_DN25712_c0_g1_i1:269-637(-)